MEIINTQLSSEGRNQRGLEKTGQGRSAFGGESAGSLQVGGKLRASSIVIGRFLAVTDMQACLCSAQRKLCTLVVHTFDFCSCEQNGEKYLGHHKSAKIFRTAIAVIMMVLCLSGTAWGQAKPENSKGAKATKATAVQAKADKKAAKAKAAMVEGVKRSATKSADSRRNQAKPAKQNSENLPEFKESWKNNTDIFSRYHANKWSEQGLYSGLTPQQEQIQYRTEHSKTFDNGDGTFSYMYIGDLHYKDANGSWQDIEVNIEKTNNGPYRYANTKNKFQTYYSDSPSDGIMMKYLGKNLVFAKDYRFEFLDTQGNTIKDNQRTGESAHQDDYRTLSYRNFYSEIDYNIIQLGRGVETGFAVKSRNAVADGAKTVRISQTVELPQGAYVVADGKKQGKTFRASEFEVMIPGHDSWITFQSVVVYDAHVDMDYIMKRAEIRHEGGKSDKDGKPIEDPMAKYSYKAMYNVSQSGSTLTVSFDLPAEWLLASERTYPLFIDPTVTVLTGTTSVTSPYTFYNTLYHDSRWDVQITDAEMSAAGISNGATISACGLLCSQAPGLTVANARIDLNNSAWTTGSFVTTNWTNCYYTASLATPTVSTTTWNTYTFQTNFTYSSANNNLLVRLSKDGTGYTSGGGNYCVSNSTGTTARGGYQDNSAGWPFNSISNQGNACRPAMQLTYTNSAGCSHTEKAVRSEDEVGEGVTRPYYNYSYTQILYQPSEICNSNTSPKIYGIAFRYYGDECYDDNGYDCYNEITRNLTVYLSETSNNELTGWETSGLTQVFTGNVTFTVGNWTWITFSTPYNCNGSDNIVVTINDRTGSWLADASEYYFYADDADATDTYKVLTYYDDDTQVTNPANPGVSYDTHGKWRPYTKFCVDCIACTDPELSGCPSASVNVGETIPLSVSGGSVTWSVSPAGAVTFSSTTALAPTITANTAGNVTITATVAAANGYCAKTLTCSFTISNQTCTIVGGSDATTSTTNVAPVFGLYNNSWVEMIYTADEIGSDKCKITSIAFKSSASNSVVRNIKVYAGFTEKDHFNNNDDFVSASDMTLVNTTGSWSITGAGWYTFTFSTPLEYNDCSKNLIIGFLSTASSYSSTSFYSETTPGSTVIYGYSDYTDPTSYINDMTSYGGNKNAYNTRPIIKICQEDCCTNSRTVTLTGCPSSNLTSGNTFTGLSASVSPTGGGTTITWGSSDESVATVSNNGTITARNPGTATITATVLRNGQWCCAKGECEVTVVCATSPTTLSLSPASGSIEEGQSIDLSELLTNGTGQTVTWTSSATGIATVDAGGVVTGVAAGGPVTITARVAQWTDGGITYCEKTATYTVTVTAINCTDGSWNMTSNGVTKTIECDKTYCFYDSGGDGQYGANENYTWHFAPANPHGIVHITFVKYSVEGGSYDYMTITGTTTDGTYTSMTARQEFIASVENGTIDITWRSDNSVSYDGWKAIVTAEGCCTDRTGDFEFCRSLVNIASGDVFTMPVTNTLAQSGDVAYESSNPSVATVDNNGMVTGGSTYGSTTITATISAGDPIGYCEIVASYIVRVGVPGNNEGCVEVGNGGTTTGSAPLYALYNNSWVQMIYDKMNFSEYCSSCRIKSITFYPTSDNSYDRNISLYVGSTDRDYFSGATDFIPETGTPAYSGTWHITAGEKTFTFTNPVDYNCSQNLLIGMLSTSSNWSSNSFRGTTMAGTSVIYGYNDTVVPTPSNMSGFSSTSTSKTLPDIRVCFDCNFEPDPLPELTLTGVPSTVVCSPAAISIDAAVADGTVDAAALSAALPSGLTYSTSTHKITGSLTTGGTYEFDIIAKSDDGCLKDTKHVTITVNELGATIYISNP